MSNRHLARTIAMQTLYEWDFVGKPPKEVATMLERNEKEFSPAFDDHGFAKEIVDGVMAHQAEIDATIVKYAPEWPLDQITIVDRNILRIGVYELIHADRIPSKVAINEAIEIAKAFGGESSGRFVNGVLGAIFRDRSEAGSVKPIDIELKEKATKEKPAKDAKLAADAAPETDHSS